LLLRHTVPFDVNVWFAPLFAAPCRQLCSSSFQLTSIITYDLANTRNSATNLASLAGVSITCNGVAVSGKRQCASHLVCQRNARARRGEIQRNAVHEVETMNEHMREQNDFVAAAVNGLHRKAGMCNCPKHSLKPTTSTSRTNIRNLHVLQQKQFATCHCCGRASDCSACCSGAIQRCSCGSRCTKPPATHYTVGARRMRGRL
jgi:hypothetical protein